MTAPAIGTSVWITVGLDRTAGVIVATVPATHDRPPCALVKVEGISHPVERPLSQIKIVEDRHAA